jgi:6-phosphogluconolactonase
MTIGAFAYPGLEQLQVLPTIPDAAPRDGVSTAQIMVEPSGRFVYVSNRGHDSIAMFAIDQDTGTLTALGNVSTQGRTPRNFSIDPTGQRMYVANQHTDTIVQFNINQDSGVLEPTGAVTEVGAPVCIVFR